MSRGLAQADEPSGSAAFANADSVPEPYAISGCAHTHLAVRAQNTYHVCMKRVLFCIHLVLCALVFGGIVPAAHAFTGERIRAFVEDVRVTPDRQVVVTESISYDFGSSNHHGIYRDIPTTYQRYGGSYKLRFHVLNVLQDDAFVEWQESDSSGMHRVKIGNPTEYISGTHNYAITYTSDRILQDFPAGTEFYWNVTGNEWGVPIDFATVTVHGPDVPTGTACFTGPSGSTESRCTVTSNGAETTLVSTLPLVAGEGLTVALRWTQSVFVALPWWTQGLWFLQDNWVLPMPVVVFVVMLVVWWMFGKEPKGRGTIIAQYEPPAGMTLLDMDALVSQVVQSRAILGTILDLARRGYLRLEWSKVPWLGDTFAFFWLRAADDTMTPQEQTLFRSIFDDAVRDEGVLLSSAARRIGLEQMSLHKTVLARLRDQGFFTKSPDVVRGVWSTVAGVIFVAGFLVSSGLLSLSLILSSIIVFGFGYQMPCMTRAGAERKEEVEGFKLFLTCTEKDRLDFANAPELRPETFERFLPAAVALGVEDKWTRRFDMIGLQQPSYVTMPVGMSWNMSSAHTFASSLRAIGSSYGSSSGFSGGSSGGGGGGGGGGSW